MAGGAIQIEVAGMIVRVRGRVMAEALLEVLVAREEGAVIVPPGGVQVLVASRACRREAASRDEDRQLSSVQERAEGITLMVHSSDECTIETRLACDTSGYLELPRVSKRATQYASKKTHDAQAGRGVPARAGNSHRRQHVGQVVHAERW